MFKEKYNKHEEGLAKLNRLENLIVTGVPFIIGFLFIYLLAKLQ